MAKKRKPRSGSLQFWPRKRAKRGYARIRAKHNRAGLNGFAGYKVGMTNISVIDNNNNSLTKNQEINMPVTIIECPPVKIFSTRFYKQTNSGLSLQTEILSQNINKNLSRKTILPKKQKSKLNDIKTENFDQLGVILYTQPQLTGVGKKKPEIFELKLGGSKEEQLTFVKDNTTRDINLADVFTEGQQVDIHSVTKGKGTCGPVKRFGISLRSHKSEKTIRGPGSLGPWKGQGGIMWRIAFAGQHGFHQRTEYNKWVIKFGKEATEITPNGGFHNYGLVKSDYLLLKGSVGGSKKRLIIMTDPQRPKKNTPRDAPTIEAIKK